MRFSVWPSLSQPWSDVVEVATHAEATGWDGVYVADHFMGDGERAGDTITPMLEATAGLAALAALTDRVRLGSLVFGITYRHPAVLAKWAATVDHISAGRLLLGVGAGWQENEHEQYGIELGPPGVRIDRFVEALDVLTGLLREPVTTVSREALHADRRRGGAEARAGPTAVADRRQGRPHARRRRPLRRRVEHVGVARGLRRAVVGARRAVRVHRPRPGDDRPLVPGAVVRHRRSGQGRRPRDPGGAAPGGRRSGRAADRGGPGRGPTSASTRSSFPTSRSAAAPNAWSAST